MTGTPADGETLTISGSGFGGGPNVLVFDDFESGNGHDGDAIPLTSPEVGKWSSYTTEGRPRYSSDARSGTHGFRISDPAFDPNGGSGNRIASFTELLPAPTTEIFISYASYVPAGTTFPGASRPNTLPAGISSYKGLWLYDGPQGYAGGGEADICLPTWSGFWNLGGNSGSIAKNLGAAGDWFSFKNWNRFSVWLKANPASPVTSRGTIVLQTVSLDTGHTEVAWTDRSPFQGSTAFDNPPSSGKWDRFTIPGWWGNGDNAHNQMTYDDIYVAVGANAAARVEIGDNPTYKSARRLAISTPVAWSDGQISVTVRAGPFTAFSGTYLFVIDAHNNVSKGYALGGIAPNAPTGVTVN